LHSKKITYSSTNKNSPAVSFKEALLQGLAPDGGLYLPGFIPKVPESLFRKIPSLDYAQLAFELLRVYLSNEIDDQTLEIICNESYNFHVPLQKVYDRKYIMRLDHGPTASFKDFAARLMGRLMQYYLAKDNRELVILTATSGDTGSAVASAFYGLQNIKVVILYPRDEVSDMQRLQMTSLKKNIKVIAIDGKFDDCQLMAKQAFGDPLLSSIPLSSANSINIGRLLPQSVYYFYAWAQLAYSREEKIIFSVPSGNFGNLMGGLLAREMGLPVKRFVIATNENKEVPEYLRTGNYKIIAPSVNCISSAMNVGHPSNMARIISLFGGRMNQAGEILSPPEMKSMQSLFFSTSVTDGETIGAIARAYQFYNLLLEPHGAIAWEGLHRDFKANPEDGSIDQLSVSLETAHPAKFPLQIKEILNITPALPDSLADIKNQTEEYVSLNNDYDNLRDFLRKNYGPE
jgi:threonine synthase